jgi:hypothetical protein
MKFTPIAFLLTAAFAQSPKPDVNWAAVDKQIEAVRAAAQSRDIEKAKKAASDLWQLAVQESQKVASTPADRLKAAEEMALQSTAARTLSLPYLASLAIQAGEIDKADLYARETLQTPSPAWDSIHTGNVVLGLVALRHNDVASAKTYLLAAARTKGIARMERWGPNLALAKELVERGENQIVLEYLQACKAWAIQNPKLDEWIATLKGGHAPDWTHEYAWYQ